MAAPLPKARIEQSVPEAWVRLLRAHSALTRQMDADLIAEHGLTLNDYEVLLYLSQAPDGRLRRVDLSQRVLLTQSGITRLLAGLERTGLVARADCPVDGRVVYAQITSEGRSLLSRAAVTHRRGIRELFAERLSTAELAQLAELLGRLPGATAGDC